MWLLEQIAEARIAEAMARGEFDELPGSGQPLTLGDDSLVPEDLRVGYRLLKNAGYLPPELELRHEIARVEELLSAAEAAEDRAGYTCRLRFLMARLSLAEGRDTDLRLEQAYFDKLQQRLR